MKVKARSRKADYELRMAAEYEVLKDLPARQLVGEMLVAAFETALEYVADRNRIDDSTER